MGHLLKTPLCVPVFISKLQHYVFLELVYTHKNRNKEEKPHSML